MSFGDSSSSLAASAGGTSSNIISETDRNALAALGLLPYGQSLPDLTRQFGALKHDALPSNPYGSFAMPNLAQAMIQRMPMPQNVYAVPTVIPSSMVVSDAKSSQVSTPIIPKTEPGLLDAKPAAKKNAAKRYAQV